MRTLLTSVATRLRRLLQPTKTPPTDSAAIWCVVANVAARIPSGPGGRELRRGTKHFRAGTLVYCSTALWGDGYENITVVARHRGSNRYVTMVLPSARLTKWRAKLVYSPHVIREFQKMGAQWNGSGASRKRAETLAASMAKEIAP